MNTKAPPDTTGGAHLTPLMLTGNDAFMLTPNVAQHPPTNRGRLTNPANVCGHGTIEPGEQHL
jgi:hypothetical protein